MIRLIENLLSLIRANFLCILNKVFNGNKFKYSLIIRIGKNSVIRARKNGIISLCKNVAIGRNVTISALNSGILTIEENVSLNNNCEIVCHKSIKIGEGTMFGPNVMVYDHDHDFRIDGGIRALKYKTDSIVIGKNVWIGANTIILKGSKIGDGCVIGAGSVIRGKYPKNTVIVQKRETQVSSY